MQTRKIYITKRSQGTVQLAQLLKCICTSTNGETIAFVGLDKTGDPVEINEYCSMFYEKFPCEGHCWRGITNPPYTSHITIVTPGLVARVCTEPGCGSFFILDLIDAPLVAGLPYDIQKAAMRDQDIWYKRNRQGNELELAVQKKRKTDRENKVKYDARKKAEKLAAEKLEKGMKDGNCKQTVGI